MKNFLGKLPPFESLRKQTSGLDLPDYREVNAHIHTPYSFSAFPNMETIFRMAKDENISVLGINDFFIADGYMSFYEGCIQNKIFPLFNIEFIGLLKEEQKKGIRINDPNNPGRIYFCGKGLDYPFRINFFNRLILRKVIGESQSQIKEMIKKLNGLIEKQNQALSLSYESVKKEFAMQLVRERHLAKAIRVLAESNYSDREQQVHFLESLYGKKSKVDFSEKATLENEIRSNLLKSGGPAFVKEDERSFPELRRIIKLIIIAGGIPCYPVLLDDTNGKYTEFEADPEKLYISLKKYGINCIELIPGRNDGKILQRFVEFFHSRDFVITFGTEHNTPELIPLTVTSRGSVQLDDSIKEIAYQGACIIAAHQYLRADGRQGYVLPDGTHNSHQNKELADLGKLVIEYYLRN